MKTRGGKWQGKQLSDADTLAGGPSKASNHAQIPREEAVEGDRKGLRGAKVHSCSGGGQRLEGWRGLDGSRPLRDSPTIRTQDSSAGPEESCAASAQGRLAGWSRGPQ